MLVISRPIEQPARLVTRGTDTVLVLREGLLEAEVIAWLRLVLRRV